MPFALKSWLESVSIKEQCELLSALRGPDMPLKRHVKAVVRWLRYNSVISVKEGHFTKRMKMPSPGKLGSALEWAPVHYAKHLMEGLYVMGRYHDSIGIRAVANEYAMAILDSIA